MKEEVRVMELDRSEQGMVLTALADYRNKQIGEGKPADLAEELIEELFDAPTKRIRKARSRDDAR
ncbi:MAG: hypothetical protein FWF44_08270 [Defluviitaleaceae bacterium]|nr:hypothetical protein [Defluviitaleaceae bacterium]